MKHIPDLIGVSLQMQAIDSDIEVTGPNQCNIQDVKLCVLQTSPSVHDYSSAHTQVSGYMQYVQSHAARRRKGMYMYVWKLATVEPLNNGHAGDKCFVHYPEVVPSSNMHTVVGRGHAVCPF